MNVNIFADLPEYVEELILLLANKSVGVWEFANKVFDDVLPEVLEEAGVNFSAAEIKGIFVPCDENG